MILLSEKKRDTSYSDYFDFWPEWLFKYYNELALCEAIESAYIIWKSEQQRLTPKYEILRPLVTLVNHYFVTMEEDVNKLKITCKQCDGFVTFSGRSR